MDLEEVWRIREEEVYPQLFGTESRGIFTLTSEIFADRFGQISVDPRWLHHGVIEFAPTKARRSWLYVTSGYSNPWYTEPADYDANGESGSGVEFTFQTTEPGDWAIHALQNMLAFDILLAAGRFEGKGPLETFDRMPAGAPINGDEACLIRNLLLTETLDGPGRFALPSGHVWLSNFVGLTDAELQIAKDEGSPALLDKLRASNCHVVTDPKRASLV